ncbi:MULTISPECIES: hypothetical protein [unclassified Microcoleus]|uniref:hypothetical protein n=1 Tax=unclassified Microcoleus TaxID=2642155 RepID=UPI002FD6C43E
MLSKIQKNIQKAQENRCSNRRKRPPLYTFPPYFGATFSTRQYDFTDSSGNNSSGLMSDKVSVILLPGAFNQRGSVPGQDQLEPITIFLRMKYPEYNFIKGHMWNQEIGGQGVTDNLVPLTSAANRSHNYNVEEPLKNALRDFVNFYNTNKSDHPDYDKVYGFKYVVEIENAPWPSVRELIVPNSIHVQLFPIKCNIFYEIIEDSIEDSIIYNAISSNTKNHIERLSGGIWIDQAGNMIDRNGNVIDRDGNVIAA